MEIQKVKEWLEHKGKQFAIENIEVEIGTSNEKITHVKRLKDSMFFGRGMFVKTNASADRIWSGYIINFFPDLINVVVSNHENSAITFFPINEIENNRRPRRRVSHKI